MRELSTFEDFVLRTLSTLGTRLEKLAYCASLRNGKQYEHWGLERHHGREEARQAMKRAHRESLQEVLRTPLPELNSEALRAESDAEKKVRLDPCDESVDAGRLLPDAATKDAAAHLTYVLKAVRVLTRRLRKSSHRAA